MTNIVDANGLSLDTYQEVYDRIVIALKAVYGSDINVDADSPDGQNIGIFVQEIMDDKDLIEQVYNSFDPDSALGVVLDQRVGINGIQRQAGSYTITNITVVTDRALSLYGQDQTVEDVYTIEDDAGTQWQLVTTEVIAVAGSQVLIFIAVETGATATIPNTITTPSTIVLGVVSVNNPTVYTTLGEDEETDVALKIRRQKATSISSIGFTEAMQAVLEDVDGITFAKIWENDTNATDVDGTPGHSYWIIIAGTATDLDIATAIYAKRSGGSGMRGAENYDITQDDESLFTVRWDEVVSEDIFLELTISTLDGLGGLDQAQIKTDIVANYIPGVYAQVNNNDLGDVVRTSDSNALVDSSGFAYLVGGPFLAKLTPSAKKNQFVLTTANIAITLV